jgi:predicted permease
MWFRRKPFEQGLDKELRYHFERLVRDAVAEGVDPDEARRRARLEFGGLEQVKDDCRDIRSRWLEDFAKDLRYAARTLRRSPGFLAVAVLSLALGMGANTAIFSLIDAVMLRAMPVRDPGRLVQITRYEPDGKPGVVSYFLWEYFRDHLKSISGASAEMSGTGAIVMDGMEEVVQWELVSGSHFALLGVRPAAGRLLNPADDQFSPAAPSAVISYRFWQRHFGLNPAAIGKTCATNDRVYTIVGVTPPQYRGMRLGRDPDVTLPLNMQLSEARRKESDLHFLTMLGRLAPGVTVQQANAELQVLWQDYVARLLPSVPEKERPRVLAQKVAVLSAQEGINPLKNNYADALLILMGIVGLVLLLACTNLSGLLVARAAAREREIAIRLAIGAGGARLMRQFFAESFVLAVLGGSAGLLLARWFTSVLVTMMANGETLLLSTAADWRVLAFTGAISFAVCILAGLAPALHALRGSLNPGLKQARGGGHPRLGKVLVMAQVAISMVLVVGATLFVSTVVKLYRTDRGMRTDGVLVFDTRSRHLFPQERAWAIQTTIVDRVRSLPGVTGASASVILPIGGNFWTRGVQVEGYTFGANESEDVAFNVVAPRYFITLGTTLFAGREFDEHDTLTSPPVAIVNQSFASYFFGNRSPLGRRVTSVNVAYEIVGVVGDAKYRDLREGVIKTMYISWMQRKGDQPGGYRYLARVAGSDPMRLASSLERLVRDVDPALRVRTAHAYSELVDQSLVTERILGTLGGFFGLLALLIACLGIFGVMAFQVSRRTNEIGLRVALGASRGGIVGMVLRDVVGMVAAGSVVGGTAALAVTGLTRKMLFGVTPTDPVVFAAAFALLAGAAFAAAWLPARRASRVDPMVALRHE